MKCARVWWIFSFFFFISKNFSFVQIRRQLYCGKRNVFVYVSQSPTDCNNNQILLRLWRWVYTEIVLDGLADWLNKWLSASATFVRSLALCSVCFVNVVPSLTNDKFVMKNETLLRISMCFSILTHLLNTLKPTHTDTHSCTHLYNTKMIKKKTVKLVVFVWSGWLFLFFYYDSFSAFTHKHTHSHTVPFKYSIHLLIQIQHKWNE